MTKKATTMSEDPRTEAVKTALHICEIRCCIDKIVENEEVTYRVVDTSGEDLERGYSGHPMGEYSRISNATERRNQLTAEYILTAADAAAWRSMESAPKDGARFLSAIEGVDRAVSIYWNGAEWLTVDGNDWRGREIYAWQPLPTPPQEQDT